MENIRLVIIGIILVIQTIYDIQCKKIPMIITGIAILFGSLFHIWEKTPIIEIGMAVLPGICCIIFSKISREALGYGDGFLLCAMGLFYSVKDMILLVGLAFGSAGIGALILLLFFRKQRKYEMAFVPFLLVAYGMDIWIKIGSGRL